jgi:hypothetical protein
LSSNAKPTNADWRLAIFAVCLFRASAPVLPHAILIRRTSPTAEILRSPSVRGDSAGQMFSHAGPSEHPGLPHALDKAAWLQSQWLRSCDKAASLGRTLAALDHPRGILALEDERNPHFPGLAVRQRLAPGYCDIRPRRTTVTGCAWPFNSWAASYGDCETMSLCL